MNPKWVYVKPKMGNSQARRNTIKISGHLLRGPKMRFWWIFTPLLVAGCAFERADLAKQAQTSLQGRSRAAILACMGPPARQAKDGTQEVFGYDSGGNEQRFSTISSGRNNRFTTGYASTRYCTVDIVMYDGVVDNVIYRGATGGLLTQGEQCAYAVAACVPQ